MPKSSKMIHAHEWVKWKIKWGELHFRCAHPDCSAISAVSLLVGKRATCAICHTTEFILTREDLKRSKPRCPDCSQTASAVHLRETKEKVAGILDDLFNTETQAEENPEEETQGEENLNA